MMYAQFEPRGSNHYVRQLSELDVQARQVSLTYMPLGKLINLSLFPTIGTHDLESHRVNAYTASIVFKVAMTLGEQLSAYGPVLITQDSLVGPCRDEAGGPQLELATYPEHPLIFEKLCLGFRTVLIQGVGQEPPTEE